MKLISEKGLTDIKVVLVEWKHTVRYYKQSFKFEDNKYFGSRNSEKRELAKNAVKEAPSQNGTCSTLEVKALFWDLRLADTLTVAKRSNNKIEALALVLWCIKKINSAMEKSFVSFETPVWQTQ